MATLGGNVLTLADWRKRLDPDGKTAKIIELLDQRNEILQDIPFREGNLPTGHQVSIRTGLPTVYFRALNSGIPTSKSTTAQVTEGTAIMESRSHVDIDVAKLNGNVAEFRLSEARPFLMAMNQALANTLFYGNSVTDPKTFNGLGMRYSDLTTSLNKANIIDAGGTGSDNTSIWFVVWGEDTVHGIFPKGSEVGLQHEDLGIDDVADSDGNRYRAFVDWFQWKAGLVVKDWQFVVRIANIDVSNLVGKSSAADIVELLIKAEHRIPALEVGKAGIYMNRTVFQMLDIQSRDSVKSGGQLSYDVVDGKRVLSFRGIPIRRVDRILNNETRVV
jgi:hypothetical protein